MRWTVGQKITVSYLSDGALLMVLFRLSEAGSIGFKLFVLNRNRQSGSGGRAKHEEEGCDETLESLQVGRAGGR